jgi:integrase
MRRRLVARNVAELVAAPAMARREMRTLSVDELGRLLTAAEDDPLRALWMVAATTGMRLGEILALRWIDVDLDRGLITVRASLQRVGGVLRMDSPKTHRSKRPVVLTALAREALARHRVEQAAHRARAANLWEERGLVFCNSVGRPLEPSNLRRRFFVPLLDRAGLEAVRFHDLRHTVATLLMGSVNPKVVSELLGHSDVATTLRVYSHAAVAMHHEAAASLDTLLGAAMDRVSNRVSASGAEAPKPRNRSRRPA